MSIRIFKLKGNHTIEILFRELMGYETGLFLESLNLSSKALCEQPMTKICAHLDVFSHNSCTVQHMSPMAK